MSKLEKREANLSPLVCAQCGMDAPHLFGRHPCKAASTFLCLWCDRKWDVFDEAMEDWLRLKDEETLRRAAK